ncbi:hypothetical protein pb186bvf_001268 [Paramecium bursaria]
MKALEESNLSLRQQIPIILAVENDCLKFDLEIQRLKQDQPQYNEDEYKEIVYEIEDRLHQLVAQLVQNQLIQQKIQQPTYLDSLNILQEFVNLKIINKQVDYIINKNHEQEMVKYQKKNFELQIENMKCLANTKDIGKKFYLRDQIRKTFQTSLRTIRSFREELLDLKDFCNNQYQLFFNQDDFIDKLKTVDNFRTIYEKILRNLKQFNYHNLSQQVKQGIQASKDLSSKEIFITFEKLQKKFELQNKKTQSFVCKNIEDIIRYDMRDLNKFLIESQKHFKKSLYINQLICGIYKDKDYLEKSIRQQLEEIIMKLSGENSKFKMIILTKAVERPMKQKSIESFQSLKSIHY